MARLFRYVAAALGIAAASAACGSDADNGASAPPASDASTSPLDASDASSACGDLSSDPQNCGRCAHDCLQGACVEGACEPVVVAFDQRSPTSLVSQGAFVYWINAGYSNGLVSILRTSKTGGATETLAENRVIPGVVGFDRGIAVDDNSVYWVEADGLYKIAQDGSADGGVSMVCSVPANTSGSSLAIDDTYVYFGGPNGTSSEHLVRCPKSGGAAEPLVEGNNATATPGAVGGIVVDDIALYWTWPGSTEIFFAPKTGIGAGAGLPNIFADQQNEPTGISIDATNIYWSVTGGGSVRKLGKGGIDASAPSSIAVGQEQPTSVAIDVSAAYWSTRDAVMTCPLTGCGSLPPRQLMNEFVAGSLAVDDLAVYMAETYTGSIVKVAK